MIDKNTLRFIAELMQSDDKEMQKLGQHIFLDSNPKIEDIDELNNIRGGFPILDTYHHSQVQELIHNSRNILDITK